VSDNALFDEDEPELLYTALHHAREPGSLSQMVFFLWYLLEHYGTDPEVTFLLDNTELYFIPCINPDGYLYNEFTNPEGGGLWRKNRRLNSDGSYGVDLNRNYGFAWGHDDTGSSAAPESNAYRGPAPFSEPETQAVRAFCESHQFLAALNYHTYGNWLLHPWGYASFETPDSTNFRTLASVLTSQNDFTTGTALQTVGYTANGNSDDWMYGEQVTKAPILAMTPEVGEAQHLFWPPVEKIVSNCLASVWQNLALAHMVHHAGWVADRSGQRIKTTRSQIDFQLTRYGHQPGTLSVSLAPLSTQVRSTGGTQHFQLTQNESVSASIDFELDAAVRQGEEVTFLLSLSNGILTWQDTLRKIFTGEPTSAFTEPANDLSQWTSTRFGLNTANFHSAPSAISDSPNGDYPSKTESVLTLRRPIDLSRATEAKLYFWANWQIETGYDYAQLLASTDGQSFKPLCGKYSNLGNRRQDNGQPIYHGQQRNWVEEVVDLADFIGQSGVFLRIRMVSDQNTNADGFNADDMELIIKTNTGTEIKDLQEGDFGQIFAFPNPSVVHGEVRLNLPASATKGITFQVFNIFGNLVASNTMPLSGESNPLPTLNLAQPGIFFLQVKDEEDNVIGFQKLVKIE
jgi:hypothetical protein